MIYTVTFNPSLDYILHIDTMCAKDINRATHEEICYGGKGINVSVILSRLGIESTALGFLAGLTGKQFEILLGVENVNTDFVYLNDGHTRINVKIKCDKEYDINANGPDIAQSNIDELIDKLCTLKDGDTLVLAGSVTGCIGDDIYEKICKMFKQTAVNIVVDATGNLLKNTLKYKPFLIKPNNHELSDLFDSEIKSDEDIEYYSKILQQMGAKNVLVSRGKDGAVLLDEYGKVHTISNVPGKIKDSVGCGDSMVAGFIAGWQKKHDYDFALLLGAACANATAFSQGLATKEKIDEMLERLW